MRFPCRIALAPLAALVAVCAFEGPAIGATATGGGKYRGATAQGKSIAFAVNGSRTRIVGLRTDLRFHDACADPYPNPVTSHDLPKISIKDSGKFSGGHATPAHGLRDGTRTAITGRFTSPTKASGSLQMKVITKAGKKRCDTGKIHFSVKLK